MMSCYKTVNSQIVIYNVWLGKQLQIQTKNNSNLCLIHIITIISSTTSFLIICQFIQQQCDINQQTNRQGTSYIQFKFQGHGNVPVYLAEYEFTYRLHVLALEFQYKTLLLQSIHYQVNRNKSCLTTNKLWYNIDCSN